FKTRSNDYGIYRIFQGRRPTYMPDEVFHTDQSLDKFPNITEIESAPTPNTPSNPFSNASILRLMEWFYNSSTSKNLTDLDSLVRDVICAPNFQKEHFKDFQASREVKHLDQFNNGPNSALCGSDGWIQTSLKIPVPCGGFCFPSEEEAPVFAVEGFFYRRPLEVIRSAFSEKTAEDFHQAPFKEYWQSSENSPPERIYSKLYNSDAYLDEHQRIRAQNCEPRPQLETVVAAIMLWSDSTQLTNFGSASLWPIYLYLGNLTKYVRLKPSSFAAHHLAYIPKLGDSIQDFYKSTYNHLASSEVLTHLRREIIHAVWHLLLDDDFVEAYIHGIVIEFADGIFRRLFPQFFIYSADYPEKVLLACIKYLGEFPCPRCSMPKSQIYNLGTEEDGKLRQRLLRVDNMLRRNRVKAVRQKLYKQGENITSKGVQKLLAAKSLTATKNAFSEKLSPHGFDFHTMLVPDLLHEFELGVWKATFIHLIRILRTQGEDAIAELNSRYRQIPTFGSDTIQKFTNNVSSMKKLAARDYEDLLQCAIPVFEGLLPDEDDTIVHNLLFELTTWHGLAKLHLHTESTITALEASSSRLGDALRLFSDTTCERYETCELPSEAAARGRRQAALKRRRAGSVKRTSTGKSSTAARKRKFNLACYKPHSLPDYPKAIRMFGTTDNYSTQVGELEHRRVKRHYSRAHKGAFTAGIAQQTQWECTLHNISDQSETRPKKRRLGNDGQALASTSQTHESANQNSSFFEVDSEVIPPPQANLHYQMSNETCHKVNLSVWLGDNKNDPALHDFLPQLKDHLLGRLRGNEFSGDDTPFTPEERSKVVFVNNRMYRHNVLRINYTSYDLRRCQDSLNPRTHSDVMVLSHEDDPDAHPYWYARIIGIFHAVVRHPDHQDPVSMDFLWVRWYGKDPEHQSGWRAKHLPRISFVEEDAYMPFGFLDPADIIRGCHLIPAFSYGRTNQLLHPSIARPLADNNEDWVNFYVNIFVDRDMLMRYRGGGVGHKSTRTATDAFLQDRDELDD
ncbi:hypothetical protein BDN70DRAFT_821197, partial [Pholiota conissans]